MCLPVACASQFLVGRLQPTLAFTTLSLFNILRFPLVVLPKALRALSEGLASMERIEAFLLSEEEEIDDTQARQALPHAGVHIVSGPDPLWAVGVCCAMRMYAHIALAATDLPMDVAGSDYVMLDSA